MASPGEHVSRTVTAAAALGFVPIAVHFGLFLILVELEEAATPAEVSMKVNNSGNYRELLDRRLAEDTLFIMAGLGFLDMIDNNKFQANDVTHFMVKHPSSIHGAMHFTNEALLAAAFIYPKLLSTDFTYPFVENAGPFQHAHSEMKNNKFANQHFFATLQDTGKMESFDTFMEGKFGFSTKMPDRVKRLGYDLDSIFREERKPVIVDVGGGKGQILMELKEAYPFLAKDNLILQEFSIDDKAKDSQDLTAMEWDFKSSSPQPICAAVIYNFLHILHNLSDIEVLKVLKKIVAVMDNESRIWVQEYSKNLRYAQMHASMIAMYGGRERSSAEWRDIAGLVGLEVTFERYPEKGEGLVEMRLPE